MVTFKYSVYHVTLTEDEVAQMYADLMFMQDAVVALSMGEERLKKYDLPFERQWLVDYFTKDKRGYNPDMLKEIGLITKT